MRGIHGGRDRSNIRKVSEESRVKSGREGATAVVKEGLSGCTFGGIMPVFVDGGDVGREASERTGPVFLA